jgi:hypothetical protein
MNLPDAPVVRSRNPVIFVLLTVLIDTIGFGVIMPVLPQLLMEIGGVDLAGAARLGGLLLVVFAGLQFLFGTVMGSLSDHYGRRPVLLGSLVAFSLNYALMGFAPNLTWLFVGRALTGIAGAVYGPAMAYVADVTPPEKRAHSFGLIGAMAAFLESCRRARRSLRPPSWLRSTSCTALWCYRRACQHIAVARSRSRAPTRSARWRLFATSDGCSA